eukprot:scaffold190515_cov73-Attheya_sp.AAC.1
MSVQAHHAQAYCRRVTISRCMLDYLAESNYLSFGSPMVMAKLFPIPPVISGTALPDVLGTRGVSVCWARSFAVVSSECIRSRCVFARAVSREVIPSPRARRSLYTDLVKRGGDFGQGLQRFLTTKHTAQTWILHFSLRVASQPQMEKDAEDMVHAVDKVVPMGLMPRNMKARFTMDSPGEVVDDFTLVELPDISVGQPKEFASSLGASWPIMQRRNQDHTGMAARVEKVRLGSVKLAKDLSNDLDTFASGAGKIQKSNCFNPKIPGLQSRYTLAGGRDC